MKSSTSVATLIGDVVQSRTSPDRAALHASLNAVLDQANAIFAPVVPLRITVGDEFQGCFAQVGEALHATLTSYPSWPSSNDSASAIPASSSMISTDFDTR